MATSASTSSHTGEVGAVAGAPAAEPRKKGYPLEIFKDHRDRTKYSCSFCAKILRDPMQSSCGHRFCENCRKTVEESCRAGKIEFCRHCQDEGSSEEESKIVNPEKMNPDKGFRKEMDSRTVRCCNKNSEKCTYIGLFKEYIKHEAEECQYRPLYCDKCGEPVSKTKMNDHRSQDCPQRIAQCEHCQEEWPFTQMTTHVEECPKAPVACSHCTRRYPREKVKRHEIKDCPNRVVTCPLEDCGQSQTFREFSRHVQGEMVKHLAWAVSLVADLEASLHPLVHPTLTTSRSSDSERPLEASGGAPPPPPGPPNQADDTLDSLRSRLAEMERQLQERLTATRQAADIVGGSGGSGSGGGGGGGGAIGGVPVAGEAASTSGACSHGDQLQSMQAKVSTLEPIFAVLHAEISRLINAIEGLDTRIITESRRRREYEEKVERHESVMVTLSASLEQSEVRLLKLAESASDVADGTLLWKISHFSQVRQRAMGGDEAKIFSRPFYTGPVGYKLRMVLYPDGDGMGRGTHLSIFLSILRGPHDPLLPWPFSQKVTVLLIDQGFKKHVHDSFQIGEQASGSFVRPTSEANTPTGFPLFLPLGKLHQPGCQYLKDDAMFIRVVVSTQGLHSHFKQFDPR